MQNRLGDLICPPSKKSFYYQGFFAVKWRAVFILGAKRTVAPPNAKRSTLLQDCFLCFCFLIPFTIRQQCIIYPPKFSTGPNSCQKSFLLLKKMRFFYIFCRFCWIFSFSCVYLWYLFKVNQPANVPTWCHIEGGYRRWKRNTGKKRHFIDSENFIVENTFLALPKWCHYIVVSNFYCDFAYDLNSLLTKNENYIIIN